MYLWSSNMLTTILC